MTSATSMIMEQAVMPMHTTKYNHKHQSFYQIYRPPYFWTRYQFSLLLQNISFHTSGQDIDCLYFCKISASILLDKIYRHFLQSFKMLNIITDYKMVPPLFTLFIMETLSLPNQTELCKAINMRYRGPMEP